MNARPHVAVHVVSIHLVFPRLRGGQSRAESVERPCVQCVCAYQRATTTTTKSRAKGKKTPALSPARVWNSRARPVSSSSTITTHTQPHSRTTTCVCILHYVRVHVRRRRRRLGGCGAAKPSQPTLFSSKLRRRRRRQKQVDR